MTASACQAAGRVYLVGGGPGDPGLITLRGVACLRRAEVVVYDYLVNPRVLDHAPPNAERVCLGRHGHGRIMNQAEINATLVDRLRKPGKPSSGSKGATPPSLATWPKKPTCWQPLASRSRSSPE